MMIQTNKVLYMLKSGVEVTVTPITLVAQETLRRKAWSVHPEPDKAPFEKPLANSFEADDIIPAEHNPDWLALNADVSRRRDEYFQELILMTCVGVPQKDLLITIYRDSLDVVKAETRISDEFVIVLYFFLATITEINTLLALALSRLPLTEKEVSEGFNYFRYVGV